MTLNIKVLGSGCPNCNRLEKHARDAVAQLGVEATIEKVSDLDEYLKYGVLATPALVVNEKLVVSGRVPAASQIVSLVSGVLAETD